MTPRSLLIAGLLALALVGVSQVASAAPERRVVVVVDALTAERDPAVLAEARAAVARSGGEATLRVPSNPTDQLSVTHLFAARGYDLVVGVGLNERIAVTPVARRFPRTQFLAARPGDVARAIG